MQLLLALDGILESGAFWNHTLVRHDADKLHMKHLNSDPLLHHLMKHCALWVLSGMYVYYLLRDGNEDFKHIEKITKIKFQMDSHLQIPVYLSCFRLQMIKNIPEVFGFF